MPNVNPVIPANGCVRPSCYHVPVCYVPRPVDEENLGALIIFNAWDEPILFLGPEFLVSPREDPTTGLVMGSLNTEDQCCEVRARVDGERSEARQVDEHALLYTERLTFSYCK